MERNMRMRDRMKTALGAGMILSALLFSACTEKPQPADPSEIYGMLPEDITDAELWKGSGEDGVALYYPAEFPEHMKEHTVNLYRVSEETGVPGEPEGMYSIVLYDRRETTLYRADAYTVYPQEEKTYIVCDSGTYYADPELYEFIEETFRKEKESMADMSGYPLLETVNHRFREMSFLESIDLFRTKGTGILLWGDPSCWFCQRAVPVLNEAASEEHALVSYIAVYGPGNNLTKEEYEEFSGYMQDVFAEEAKDREPGFQMPEVLALKDGKIMAHHLSLAPDFDAQSQDMMNEEQKAQLKEIYREIIRSIR